MKTIKAAKTAGAQAVTPEQLERLNLFTRRELSADEVFVFTVILCDNEVDRDGEQFPEESLEKLGELFVGKTGVFDHKPVAENQSARIFETALVREEGLNVLGEPLVSLKARAYMVRCEKNQDLILEIDAGIKKEVSVGCAVEQVLCSICATDRKAATCAHEKGKTYDGALCCHKLVNPSDAYEWSFVAVPAQKNAGVTKKQLSPETPGLKKLFGAAGEVVLTKPELAALREEFSALAGLAEAGKAYLENVKRDVVKLSFLSRQELSAEVITSVVEKLTLPELLELQKSFAKSAAKNYPPAPQLGYNIPPQENSTSASFKI